MKQRKWAVAGEEVRIVTPKMFLRCGYKLTSEIVRKDYAGEVSKALAACQKALVNTLRGSMVAMGGLDIVSTSQCSSYASRLLEQAVVMEKLEQLNWGGPERKVFEVEYPKLAGHKVKVVSRRRVLTGVRHQGCVHSSYLDGDEYEPPYLEVDKVHTLYKIDGPILSGLAIWEDEILAENCEVVR